MLALHAAADGLVPGRPRRPRPGGPGRGRRGRAGRRCRASTLFLRMRPRGARGWRRGASRPFAADVLRDLVVPAALREEFDSSSAFTRGFSRGSRLSSCDQEITTTSRTTTPITSPQIERSCPARTHVRASLGPYVGTLCPTPRGCLLARWSFHPRPPRRLCSIAARYPLEQIVRVAVTRSRAIRWERQLADRPQFGAAGLPCDGRAVVRCEHGSLTRGRAACRVSPRRSRRLVETLDPRVRETVRRDGVDPQGEPPPYAGSRSGWSAPTTSAA